MIKLEKELVEKIIGYHKLSEYLAVVVDYEGEENLVKMRTEIEIALVNSTHSGVTGEYNIYKVIEAFGSEDEIGERYLYHQDEVIEELFPAITQKNKLIQSAYNWIPCSERIDWILLNVLCENKHYGKVDKVNIDYLMTTEKLKDLY